MPLGRGISQFFAPFLGLGGRTSLAVPFLLSGPENCVHQRPGIAHFLFEYSPDMEYLEIVGPADFKSIDVAAVCDVPAPRPWN